MKKNLYLFVLVASLGLVACDDDSSDDPSNNPSPTCDATTCKNGKHCEGTQCVADTPVSTCDATTCKDGKHCEGTQCVADTPKDQTNYDPCSEMTCTEGACSEGVCVTSAMKAIKADTLCDPETFVEFCDGDTVVYCDSSSRDVKRGKCDEGCVVYEDTTRGRVAQKAGCIDGGDCSTLGEIKQECVFDNDVQVAGVFVKACQKTTHKTLKYVSVNGYYCPGDCNADKTGCALDETGCDPYKFKPSCDGSILETCFLMSNLIAVKRSEFCKADCTTFGGVAMCGQEKCTEEGARKSICAPFDSMNDDDSVDTICARSDDDKLYQVRTGQHDYCEVGCDAKTGACKQ